MLPAEIQPGLVGEVERVVEEKHSPPHIPGILATPWMIAFMEQACRAATDHLLPESQTSVGTVINVRHLAPAPLGATLRVQARLVTVDGRRLTYEVVAYWGEVKIGEGTHERFIVDRVRFKKGLIEKVEASKG